MKLGFVARDLGREGFGVARYMKELYRALPESHEHSFYFFCDSASSSEARKCEFSGKLITLSPRIRGNLSRFIWDNVSLPRACLREKIDVLFCPSHVRPVVLPCKSIVCIHDMMYHLFPEQWNRFEGAYMRFVVSNFSSRAEGIVASSESTMNDFRGLFPIAGEKCSVLYPGVPSDCRSYSSEEIEDSLSRHSIPDDFILYVGGNHPRKNARLMLEAFSRLKDEVPHALVMVGPAFGLDRSWQRTVSVSSYRERVFPLGLVSRHELLALYSSAGVLAFPSSYEGFGFPPLEAMACNCPVVCFGVSSLPEVVGEAGIQVPIGNTVAFTEALRDVLLRPEVRDVSILRGKSQVSQFSWEKAAVHLLRKMQDLR